MKKWAFLLIFTICNLGFAAPLQNHKIDEVELSSLTQALDIPEGANIIAETQKAWLRKPGQELWEMQRLSKEQDELVLNWARENGLFDPWKPSASHYDKAIILGATSSRMRTRLEYLKSLWEEGIRFDKIVWLTGDRPLDTRVDDLFDRCTNESEAAHTVWEETDLPQEMRNLPVLFVATPMKDTKRPNRKNTIVTWLEIEPDPCQALFVCDQPFCGHQFSVIKTYLPDSFNFDVVGPGADPSVHPAASAIILDTIARWIYQENLQNQ